MATDASKSGRRRRRSPSCEDQLQEAVGVSVAAADEPVQGGMLVPVEHPARMEKAVRAERGSSTSLQEATTALIQAVDEAQHTESLLRQQLDAAEELNSKQQKDMDELRAENAQLRVRKHKLEELVSKQIKRINEHEARLRVYGAKALAASAKPGSYKRLRRVSMSSQEAAGSTSRCISAQKEETDASTSHAERQERKGRKSLPKERKLATKPFRSAMAGVKTHLAGAATATNGTTASGEVHGISKNGIGSCRDDALSQQEDEAAHHGDITHANPLAIKLGKDAERKMCQRQLQSADPDGSRPPLAGDAHLPEQVRPERSRDREALERLKNIPGLRVWATNPALPPAASGGLVRTASSPALIEAKEKEMVGNAARAPLARASTSHALTAFQPLARSGSSRHLDKPNDFGSPSSRALVAMGPPQGQVRAEGSGVASSKPNSGVPCRCVVRGREKRQALTGFDCELCAKFHTAVGGNGAAAGSHCHEAKHSRHRMEYEPVCTPPGFWDLSFPVHQRSQ